GGLAIAVTEADYRLAVTCRTAAGQITSIFPPSAAGHTVWFGGHSGFQYYMEQGGARPLSQFSRDVQPDDIVIYPVHHFGASPGGTGMQYVTTINVGSPGIISTMQSDIGAEFYCSFGQGLPFVFGPVQPESFIALRVTPATQINR